jgi:hypothetical protein
MARRSPSRRAFANCVVSLGSARRQGSILVLMSLTTCEGSPARRFSWRGPVCRATSMRTKTQARFRAVFSTETKPDTQGNGSPRTDFSVMDSPHVPQSSLEPHPVPTMLSRRYVTGRTQLAGVVGRLGPKCTRVDRPARGVGWCLVVRRPHPSRAGILSVAKG